MTKMSGEGTMAMTDDWDLDVALQQCRHSLRVQVQTIREHSGRPTT